MLTFIFRETERIPTPAAALGLALASLGWILESAFPLGGFGQALGAFFAAPLLLAVAIKFLLHPALVRKELTHPVLGSVMPTLCMGFMVASKAIGLASPLAGQALWILAVAAHCGILCGFARRHLRHFELARMLPSWFIPPVGIITAALTCPGGAFTLFAQALLAFGMASFGLLLPLMLYRLIVHAELADAVKPTLAILAAPASLSLAGYLSIAPDPSLLLCMVLLGLALLLTTTVYLSLPRLLRLPFSPAFASFTFPLVIGATALYKASALFARSPVAAEYAEALRWLASIELLIAALVVGCVCILYARAFLGAALAMRRLDDEAAAFES